MTTFQWKSSLHVEQFDLDRLNAELRADVNANLPKNADKSQPWCRLIAPLRFVSARLGEQEIPVGFIYDQASVPWYARWYLNPGDPAIVYAACLHDFLSPWPGEDPPAWDVDGRQVRLTSDEAAEELYDGMRASGAGWFISSIARFMVKKLGPKF